MSRLYWVVIVIACWITPIIIKASPILNSDNTSSNWTTDREDLDDLFLAGERTFPTVMDIYPEVEADLTRVTWAHGVDSKKKLRQALRSNVMMIETDVSLGKLKSDASSGKRPIMAHPPVKISDLSLEDFLDSVLDDDQRRGIKLDFKSTSVLEPAFDIIKSREDKIDVPLWLNADIIQGPVGSTADPINPTVFLSLSKLYFPSAVLSVGWTTRYGPSLSEQLTVIKDGFYTFDQVHQMRDALAAAQIVQPVTFPIRAGLSTSVESRENFLWLLNQVPGSTVTIWSSFGDEVDIPELLKFIDSVGKNRVYIDVHSGLRCQLSRYRTFYTASSWIGSLWVGRTGRLTATAGLLALVTYMTCATSFLPWNTESYTVQ